jgi:hypothetical protein
MVHGGENHGGSRAVPGEIAAEPHGCVRKAATGCRDDAFANRTLTTGMHHLVTILTCVEFEMSRWVLFAVAAASVLMAQFVDRGSKDLAQNLQAVRSPLPADDNILTGSIRRQPPR